MSYTANIYNVLIASPSDLITERKIALEVIAEWNENHSFKEKIFLVGTGWETLPPVINNQHVQSSIDRKLLKRADILLAIFWLKAGTPVGAAPSGTVHELDSHVADGKPALLYFSEKPAKPTQTLSSQFEEVLELKSQYYSKGKVETVESEDEFRSKFRNHLTRLINDVEYNIVGYRDSTTTIIGSLDLLSSELTEQGKEILFNAVKDKNDRIIYNSNSYILDVNTINLMHHCSQREIVGYKEGMELLLKEGYIEGVGMQGEVFKMKTKGYKSADVLINEPIKIPILPDLAKEIMVALKNDNIHIIWLNNLKNDRARYSTIYHHFSFGHPTDKYTELEVKDAFQQLEYHGLMKKTVFDSYKLTIAGFQVRDSL